MRFSVRAATREDYEGLNALFAEGDAFHREALPHLFRGTGEAGRTKEFLSDLMDEDAKVS